VLDAYRQHLTDGQHFVDGMNRLGHVRSGRSKDVESVARVLHRAMAEK
jgi:hypothetical protein